MKIGIVTEMSTATRNKDVYNALVKATEGQGHEIINFGMTGPEDDTLSYLMNGYITGLMLNLGRVDFMIGGCGTGTGYINAALAFPNVSATMCLEPIDAWLFPQINDGNCISLALNKGYGWAAENNLVFMFEKLFDPSLKAAGYPRERKEIQNQLAKKLIEYSVATHKSMADCTRLLDQKLVHDTLHHHDVWETVDIDNVDDPDLKEALLAAYNYEE